jgi:hypothetical protein
MRVLIEKQQWREVRELRCIFLLGSEVLQNSKHVHPIHIYVFTHTCARRVLQSHIPNRSNIKPKRDKREREEEDQMHTHKKRKVLI